MCAMYTWVLVRLAKWMALLGLELQAIVSCQTWVLGIKFWPYGCTGSILTHEAISPTL